MIPYDKFAAELNRTIKYDVEFYRDLLEKVIDNPKRYTGIFRVSNVSTKLVQNATQIREIKFGDFLENIVTKYIEIMGYISLDKSIGVDDDGNALEADQVFCSGDTIYLIEQKVRDDHDSTKKRGQYDNFRKKYQLLQATYPDYKINASMWFIDDGLVKNKRYYEGIAASEQDERVSKHVYYGGAIFDEVFERPDVWQELCAHLSRSKKERSQEILKTPDFDTSEEIYQALRYIKEYKPRKYKKLLSDKPAYVQLRAEVFPTGANLARIA